MNKDITLEGGVGDSGIGIDKTVLVVWPGDSLECTVTYARTASKGPVQLGAVNGNRLVHVSFDIPDPAPHVMAIAPGEGHVTIKLIDVTPEPPPEPQPQTPPESPPESPTPDTLVESAA